MNEETQTQLEYAINLVVKIDVAIETLELAERTAKARFWKKDNGCKLGNDIYTLSRKLQDIKNEALKDIIKISK